MRHKPDLGSQYTDAELRRLEKRLRAVYEEAGRDINKKMTEFAKAHAARDANYRAMVAAGKMKQADYEAWMRGQVFQGKQWAAKKEQIADTLYHANDTAQKMINGQTTNVFAFNANYMSYSMEHDAGVDLGFNMYDSATVTRLIKDDPNILPFKKLNREKDVQWNWQNLRSQLTQGIIQGESIDKITSRLVREVPNRNWKQMRTHARTAFTSAQNAGRLESLHSAEEKGIKVKKQWMATLDERTRWMHQELDGQVQELDAPFEVDAYTIMYPGDPHAHPSMTYNCRCTLVQSLVDYPEKYKRRDNINGEEISNMTYREWESAKMAAETQNDWNVEGREIEKSEIDALKDYGKSHGINMVDLSKFDGDADVLRSEIDTLNKYMNDLPVNKKVTLTVAELADEDFGETRNRTVVLSQKAMRNRTVTEANINAEPGYFASTKIEDLSAHEYGHVYSKINGINGLDVAKQAYYNVYGEEISIDDLTRYLKRNISKYSIVNNNKEIIPEILAKDNSNRTEFTSECIRELRRRSR